MYANTMTSNLDAQLTETETCNEGTCQKEPTDKRWEETINGITYKVIVIEETEPEMLTWYGSKRLCESYGYELPVPTSDEMNNFLVNAAPAGVYAEIHLGIKRTFLEEDSQHHWGLYQFYDANKRDTSKAITYTNWHQAEPNGDKTRETAVGLIVNYEGWHGKWYNFYTSSNRGVQYKGRPVFHICMKQVTQIPADYNLPDDYTFAMNSWGNSFYKTYGGMNYADAKAQCESDGAYLATPRSEAENSFIAGLIPDQSIWIGVNDIDEEGKFVAADGLDVSFTKWYQKVRQPDNYQHTNGNDEDGVQIWGKGGYEDQQGFWNDQQVTNRVKFVCSYNIPTQVWHGDSDIATITSNAGEYREDYDLSQMFDDDYVGRTARMETFWMSELAMKSLPKPIVIEFDEPIQFHELTILKRVFYEIAYLNVCLILNNDVDNELCTDSRYGFAGVNDKDSRFITWRKLTDGVKRIDLVFRDQQFHAYITDLKVYYNKEEKRTIATINGSKYEAILFENTKPETENWAGSKKLCEDYGFQLPVPDSDEMNDFLTNFAPSGVYGEIHLGIEMEASEPNEDYKFNNVYSNEAISYSNWHRHEPNDAKTGRSVVGLIVHNNGWHAKWYDFLTSSKRGVQYKGRPVHHICMKKIPKTLEDHNPLLTWHGESDVATYSTDGGVWDPIYGESLTYDVDNLFDDDTESIWHSSADRTNSVKTFTIIFNEEIQFEEITIMKWKPNHERYKNICLKLDDNNLDKLCSYKEDGSTDSRGTYTMSSGVTVGLPNPGRYITFKRPTRDVKKITLEFRRPNSVIHIADLKIKYRTKPQPSAFALPDDYLYYATAWGNKFYKVYGKNNWSGARAQCESDGAILAIPSSAEENQFIADMVSGPVWIGVTDIDEEGNHVGVDGSELTYTNWYTGQPGQPDNYKHRDDLDEDGVHIIEAGTDWENSEGKWNDQEINHRRYQFVCSLAVKGKFTINYCPRTIV